MKVAVAEVVKTGSPVREYRIGVKTEDGVFVLHDSFLPVGCHVLVRYEPQDQFAHVVDMQLVKKLIEGNLSEFINREKEWAGMNSP